VACWVTLRFVEVKFEGHVRGSLFTVTEEKCCCLVSGTTSEDFSVC